MRRVEERSLLSILRSNLLTTLINNLVSEKLMLAEHANVLHEFHAIQTSFASGSAEKKAVFSEISCDDIAFEGTMLVSFGPEN